jgi:FlaA1/EpsC-like NDP-sugar epimerase
LLSTYTGSVDANVIKVKNLRDKVIGGFDDFEKWMYYETTGSNYYTYQNTSSVTPYPKYELDLTASTYDISTKEGKYIDGKRIFYGIEALEEIVEEFDITELIIAVRDLSVQRKNQIIDECLRLKVTVSIVPPVDQWINGGLTAGAIREVKIEDLLSREQIMLNNPQIHQDLTGKVVMVTGAAGSIGSEIVRQVLSFEPKKIIILDQAETPLHHISIEVDSIKDSTRIHTIIADIKDRAALDKVFKLYRPEMVYHAAAYKHVPLMENNPTEAVLTNVKGTKNLVDLALDFNVHKFVMISTDKAVNPTNVMGASKRIAEIYAQTANQKGITKIVTITIKLWLDSRNVFFKSRQFL